MPLQNKIDMLIEDCITELSDDNINKGAECLNELAQLWSKAGLGMQSFLNMRKHIVDSAIEKADKHFIAEKLTLAERELREKRTGSIIIQH